MRLASVLGILMLSAMIMLLELRGTSEKRARAVVACITLAAAALAILLLFQPGLPGPTQLVKLLFGKIDKIMK